MGIRGLLLFQALARRGAGQREQARQPLLSPAKYTVSDMPGIPPLAELRCFFWVRVPAQQGHLSLHIKHESGRVESPKVTCGCKDNASALSLVFVFKGSPPAASNTSLRTPATGCKWYCYFIAVLYLSKATSLTLEFAACFSDQMTTPVLVCVFTVTAGGLSNAWGRTPKAEGEWQFLYLHICDDLFFFKLTIMRHIELTHHQKSQQQT